jgi:hypothetical protein
VREEGAVEERGGGRLVVGRPGKQSVQVHFHSYRSAKMANVQVICAKFLTRILTHSQPLDKPGTPTNL